MKNHAIRELSSPRLLSRAPSKQTEMTARRSIGLNE